MIVMVKVGVELVFEIMIEVGIIEEFVYYELLYELLLIVNIIVRKKLFEMNCVIFDIVEYGCYLFDYVCKLLLIEFMKKVEINIIGKLFLIFNGVDNIVLIVVNKEIC